MTKRVAAVEVFGSEQLTITPLGAGSEVGRSCIIIRFKGKTIMLDCGIHPAYTGLAGLPFFDEIDPESVDLILVTHFHLDHAAALPYFMEKTPFKGRVYMTHPTKAIYKWLLADYIKVTGVAGTTTDEQQLYTEADLTRSYERITAIDYHQEIDHNGIKFVALNAGHVLGAAMFLVEIAGVRILYTGDYSREEDRHLMAAETPNVRPDVLVCESTYGVHSHQPRLERERRFTGLVHSIVGRGGRCLIPVFALGRAQELLLILDEYWQTHPELHGVPVYYASSLAKKCMAVYQTYVNMMNERIRRQIALSNPFIFKHVSNLRSMEHFNDDGPCVMMASPAMLQSGLSRELLERWCSSPRNGLIIPGYVVEGTLAKTLLSEPKEITAMSGAILPMRMTVEYISFSAHVDFGQNSEFIDLLRPPHVILVHGEAGEMQRLRVALQHKYRISSSSTGPTVFAIGGPLPETVLHVHTPRNCEGVELVCRGEKAIKVVGQLAETARDLKEGEKIEGVLVGKDFEYQLMAPDDLAEFVSDLRPVRLQERQILRCHAPLSLVEYLLVQVFGRDAIKTTTTSSSKTKQDLPEETSLLTVRDSKGTIVNVQRDAQPDTLIVSWEGNPTADLLADSVVMLLLGADCSRAAVKATSKAHHHGHHHDGPDYKSGGYEFKYELKKPRDKQQQQDLLQEYLKNYYGFVEKAKLEDDGDECLQLVVAGHQVNILCSDFSVICEDRPTFDQVTETISAFVSLLEADITI